jgi:hypothetical protein
MNKNYFEIYKSIAAGRLPASLYEQLAPHLDGLLEEFSDATQAYMENDYQESRRLGQRMQGLRAEFEKQNRPDWVKFARQNWPEVDKYFNLERQFIDDDMPF